MTESDKSIKRLLTSRIPMYFAIIMLVLYVIGLATSSLRDVMLILTWVYISFVAIVLIIAFTYKPWYTDDRTD